MNRIGTILLVVAVVGALLAVPLGVSAATAQQPQTTDRGNATAVAPGERLAGVVGVQRAEVDGDLSDRTYEERLKRAETNATKADIVADRRDEIEQRLREHRAELSELQAARESGNITEGTYRARVATLVAEKDSTERAAGQASETARQLPADVLETRGVSVDALQSLRTNANELGGPETADIAREVGGSSAPSAHAPVDGERRSNNPQGSAARNVGDSTTAKPSEAAQSSNGVESSKDRPSTGEKRDGSLEDPSENRAANTNSDKQTPTNGRNNADNRGLNSDTGHQPANRSVS